MGVIDVVVPMAFGSAPNMNVPNKPVLMENDVLLWMDVTHASALKVFGNATRRFAKKLSVTMDFRGLQMMGVISAFVKKGVGIVANGIVLTRVVKPATFTH